MDLIQDLIDKGYLRNKRIIAAFRAVKRADFLPANMPFRERLAELDEALPIGCGQTISQPAVVAFMLELLEPMPGQNILDIGYGSGWTTALLAHIATQKGSPGKVTAIERIEKLAKIGKSNISRYGFIDRKAARCVSGDGFSGYPKNVLYARILASAAANKIPDTWKRQLKNGGIMVAPRGTAIVKIKKIGESEFIEEHYEGFVFVPLVKGTDKINNNNKKHEAGTHAKKH